MKYLILVLIFLTLTADAQLPLEKKYNDSKLTKPCLYCGDTLANFGKYTVHRIQKSLDQGTIQWMSTSGRMFFEVYIDSTGHSCIRSSKDETYMNDVKENIRRCINDLWDWSPAWLDNHTINSTVILEITFVGTHARGRFVKPDEI